MSASAAKELVHVNLIAAGLNLDPNESASVSGEGGRLLKYRLLGMWLTPASELPITIDVEFSESPDGTHVHAEVSDRQGPGVPFPLDIKPEKYVEAGNAAIDAAFNGLVQ
jgi:hypothetical protein